MAEIPNDSQRKPGLFGFGISDALIVSLVTGFAYYLAYEYELGRLHFYQLPETFVDVSLVSALKAMAAMYFAVYMALPLVYDLLRSGAGPLKKRFGWVLVMGALIFWSTDMLSPGGKLIALAIFAAIVLYNFCLPMLTHRQLKGYVAKLRTFDEASTTGGMRRHDFYDLVDQKMGMPTSFLIAWAILFGFAAHHLGVSEAQHARRYLLAQYANGLEVLLVQKIGEAKMLGLELSKKRTYTGRIRVVDLNGSNDAPRMEMVEIDPLVVPN